MIVPADRRQREYELVLEARARRLERREEHVRSVVGGAVRARRAELGLSRRALARASGLSQQQITGIEEGRTSPTLLGLVALARATGCQPSHLVSGIRPARYRRTLRTTAAEPT